MLTPCELRQPSLRPVRNVLRLISAVALVMSACASPVTPSTPDVTGAWAETFTIPGASLVLTLDSAGDGRGTYAIEAGRSGVVQVKGSVVRSSTTLVITYDYGLVETFVGVLTDANHLVAVTFTRR